MRKKVDRVRLDSAVSVGFSTGATLLPVDKNEDAGATERPVPLITSEDAP